MNTMRTHRGSAGGFTLLELMIVVAIIAILSAIAYPIYTKYITRSKLSDAQNNLAALRVSMEQYFQDNRTYASTTVATNCGVTMPTSNFFSFTCALTTLADGSSGYTATATGNAGTVTASFVFTIDQSNNHATTSAPAGWGTTPATCWITGGTCQ